MSSLKSLDKNDYIWLNDLSLFEFPRNPLCIWNVLTAGYTSKWIVSNQKNFIRIEFHEIYI